MVVLKAVSWVASMVVLKAEVMVFLKAEKPEL
jgi:hypothetical protein